MEAFAALSRSMLRGGPGADPPAIAAVSTAGYLGLVCGPPAIGLLSGLVGLVGALGLLVALCAVVVVRAGTVRRPA
jgi:hypothetical protein